MNTIHQTEEFKAWMRDLRDDTAKAKVITRTKQAAAGNFGDVKHFDGISEMRINYGSGYRVYYAKQGKTVYLLLIGGDKSSQDRDIKKAQKLWKSIKG
ncbi:type II toxin-antitoxin system RelE/ParE family toxin [Dyella sp. M7H15-1]|uniref:type II toxin-antitoxin system RelE/ParE family toxin n=1 Tax=Dyella sp. M7H15-1 TaxID=2501295 RepID=UPI00100505E5|nr:type II toxin-antitoxin system RelE/ParE family toxin [Dyella sp. M7H15-1]QAU22955.1 type II toxin-antitoxin system RelE/ParE family toxin [Dyella sp. M7H15-1]